MKGAAVILEARGGLEGAVAVVAVAVTGRALVIFEGKGGKEGVVTVVARVHGECPSKPSSSVLYRVSCVFELGGVVRWSWRQSEAREKVGLPSAMVTYM
jgi:hypothetical protein